jgi:prepilin-type N-terminal cleavage/methylation domain-containing protein
MQMKRGFTLIEVLTTIAIFGILASITGYVYGISLARSRDNQRLTDLNSVKNSLEQYYLINKRYPYNTAYKAGFSDYPFVAKYELEEYKAADISGLSCDNKAIDPDKAGLFLAPKFITTMPEDPRYPMQLTDLGGGKCSLAVSAGGPSAGYGQYLYASFMEGESDRPGQYYLMARLERDTHVSDNLFAIPARFSFSEAVVDTWGIFCSKQSPDPTSSNCSHNYYLKNSNND